MMKSKNILEYKGYHTKVQFDTEELILWGKIEGINDLVTFECENPKCIEEEFKQAVDDYLEFCEEVGKTPEKEYKGTFNVRISAELHKSLAIMAMKNGDTLNTTVEKAIEEYVNKDSGIKQEKAITVYLNETKAVSEYEFSDNKVIWGNDMQPYNDIKMKYSKEMTI